MSDRQPFPERFWSKVDIKTPEECWLWKAHLKKDGYGQFHYKGKPIPAHRIAYELTFGPIPKGLLACHRCDVRHCVNPYHLFPGTYGDNMVDMVKKRRNNPTRGHRSNFCILKESEVREIHTQIKMGVRQIELANKYKVDQSNISHIARGKSWPHIWSEFHSHDPT